MKASRWIYFVSFMAQTLCLISGCLFFFSNILSIVPVSFFNLLVHSPVEGASSVCQCPVIYFRSINKRISMSVYNLPLLFPVRQSYLGFYKDLSKRVLNVDLNKSNLKDASFNICSYWLDFLQQKKQKVNEK